MLLSISIRNFALIDKADINFASGLNILTGETGAGKSILIDSINFILGNKQTKDIIRIGKDFAYVEGVFSVNIDDVNKLLEENGIQIEDNLIISREINKSGKSISRINGRAVTVSFLKSIGKYLIDIHGQHEHQSLLNDESNIKILDLFCGEKLQNVKNKYIELYNRYVSLLNSISKISTNEKEKLRMIDLLKFQTEEITEADLRLNEDEELLKRKDILDNSGKIYNSLNTIYTKLYLAQIGESAYDALGSSLSSISSIANHDDKLFGIKEKIEELYYNLEALIEDIRSYKSHIDFNEDDLNDIQFRLDTINKLKRKYGATIEEILNYNKQSLEELNNIEKSEEILKDLKIEKEDLEQSLNELCSKITIIRKENAKKLKILIENELKYLGMEKAVFEASVTEEGNFRPNGKNTVKFLIAANPGQPLKSLSKVASGGEISRIMLAIKTVIANIDSIPTLIFDEIDTGISGRTAQAVGEKMCVIAKSHQLLCVTHLPQIAAMSDTHLKIEKNTNEYEVLTKINILNKNDKIDELARLLGGAEITDLTKKNALEVLELANKYKLSIKNKK